MRFRIEMMTAHNLSRLSRDDMASCTLVRKTGADVIHKAVVPMWIFYQFMISVVLLRILIVMLTITYKKIYDNMDTQWKYDIYHQNMFLSDAFLGMIYKWKVRWQNCVTIKSPFYACSLANGIWLNTKHNNFQIQQTDANYSTAV